MRGRRFIGTAALTCGLVVGFALPAAGAGPAQLRAEANGLRGRDASLAARADAALLDLYALDSKLAFARSRAEALAVQLDEVRREQSAVRQEIAAARSTRAAAQRGLAQQLRVLYTRGEPDAIAILLGAGSLEEAITGLENLQLSARQTRRVVRQAKTSQQRLTVLRRSLSRRASDIAALAAAARDTQSTLARARAERSAYVGRLRIARQLNSREIAALEARASQATTRSGQVVVVRPALPVAAVAPGPSPAPATLQPAPVTAGQRTLTVSSTGYALPGTTASGLPVGWGIVAVDPSVIPLGTRMTIPGYGEGVAADTGSAVQGATIDLWFPTTAQALEWGRRTVTITIR